MKTILKAIMVALLLSLSLHGYDKIIKEAYYDSYNYEKMGDYEDAIKSLMPVYKEYPNSYTPNLRLGWLYFLNKNYSNALMHYQKAATVVKSSIPPRLGIVNIYILQGKFDEALRFCGDILKTDYYNYYANLYLSQALIGKKDFQNAKAVVFKMLSLYPSDVLFLQKLATVYRLQNDLKSAAKVYEDILILDPKNVAANDFFSSKKER